MSEFAARPAVNLSALRAQRPLVHNITNFVVMNNTANALLAAGASPLMAHAAGELNELAALADALVLNLGTLDETWLAAMLKAGRAASGLGKPIVLDPVGVGLTRLRSEAAHKILAETHISVVRGNAQEILALANVTGVSGETGDAGLAQGRGLESQEFPLDYLISQAVPLARSLGTVLAVSGGVDLVSDGLRVLCIEGGSALMPRVSGMGCTASALLGAFLAVEKDPLWAAASALAFLALAGARAGQKSCGPGVFQARLIDELYMIQPEELACGARIYEKRL